MIGCDSNFLGEEVMNVLIDDQPSALSSASPVSSEN